MTKVNFLAISSFKILYVYVKTLSRETGAIGRQTADELKSKWTLNLDCCVKLYLLGSRTNVTKPNWAKTFHNIICPLCNQLMAPCSSVLTHSWEEGGSRGEGRGLNLAASFSRLHKESLETRTEEREEEEEKDYHVISPTLQC